MKFKKQNKFRVVDIYVNFCKAITLDYDFNDSRSC